ncbi:MAG TPA: helix-turn-helix domain-containing protein [Mycobacteriales bacterium]|nr:helix-turn-helix domain-containing protein [Mycobacteriales bacterium]
MSAQAPWLDPVEARAWRGVVTVLQLLPLALDRQLQADAGLTHADYAVLAVLSDAPDGVLRMSALATGTGTSQSRLSHAVRRLEERGWVERRRCDDDGRGALAALTAAGRAVLAAAAPGHVAEVRRRVLEPLSREQVAALADAAGALAEHLLATVPVDPPRAGRPASS